MTNIELNM